MTKIVFISALCIGLCACFPMSEDRATRAVEASGMHDVKITGTLIFGCGKEDGIRASFEATNQAGQKVSGVVCGGIFKGSTVRVD